jgi:hypothetical protein
MKRLSLLFVEAASDGVEISINQIIDFEDVKAFATDPLALITHIKKEAEAHNIVMNPDPAKINSWSTPIIFRRKNNHDIESFGSDVLQIISTGELPDIEFKSTLWTDLKKRQNFIGATSDELRSKSIAHSSMKSICGFLNEKGGKLFIGISDDGNIIGIEEDYEVACPKDKSADGWLLKFRETIFQFFYEADEIINYLDISLGKIGRKHFVGVFVSPRSKISLCKCKDMNSMKMYSRKGTSTEEIKIINIESYILERSKRIINK